MHISYVATSNNILCCKIVLFDLYAAEKWSYLFLDYLPPCFVDILHSQKRRKPFGAYNLYMVLCWKATF